MPRMNLDYADGTTIVVDSVDTDPRALTTLSGYMKSLEGAVGLQQSLFREDDETPGLFLYKFTTKDGRVWRQDITITPTDAPMTFSVSDPFELEEFVHHRGLRLYIIDLTRRIGVTRILIDRP